MNAELNRQLRKDALANQEVAEAVLAKAENMVEHAEVIRIPERQRWRERLRQRRKRGRNSYRANGPGAQEREKAWRSWRDQRWLVQTLFVARGVIRLIVEPVDLVRLRGPGLKPENRYEFEDQTYRSGRWDGRQW